MLTIIRNARASQARRLLAYLIASWLIPVALMAIACRALP